MEITHTEFNEQILIVASELDLDKSYSKIFEMKTIPLPKIVEMVVYSMFTNNYIPSLEAEQAVKYMRLYSIELQENGYVSFN